MKELSLSEFLSGADDYVKNAAIGDEFYSIETSAGKAILINEDEWKILTDALRVTLGIKPQHCD